MNARRTCPGCNRVLELPDSATEAPSACPLCGYRITNPPGSFSPSAPDELDRDGVRPDRLGSNRAMEQMDIQRAQHKGLRSRRWLVLGGGLLILLFAGGQVLRFLNTPNQRPIPG